MRDWDRVADQMEYALQPIVEIKTGRVAAVEALLRGHERAGFASIHELLDAAYADRALYRLDSRLRRQACEKFAACRRRPGVRLFYNLDPRVLEMPDYRTGYTAALAREFGIAPADFCLEISERHQLHSVEHATSILRRYQADGFRVALDDYGAGFSGLQLLYHAEPDYIKVDRFFISKIDSDTRKFVFIQHLVATARALGIQVIAEGVETAAELAACREIGCDFAQGYFIARPTTDLSVLRSTYALERQPVSLAPYETVAYLQPPPTEGAA